MIEKITDTGAIGGFQPFRLGKVLDISSVPFASSEGVINNDVNFRMGKDWIDINPQYLSADYEEQSEQSIEGDFYEAKYRCFIPKATYDRLQEITKLEFSNFVIDATDNIGERRLIGTEKYSMRLMANLTIPKKVNDIQGFELVFTGILKKRAPKFNP